MSSAAEDCVLPEGCIAHILSLTTPADACRLALVCRIFSSAASSDDVWERLLPSDYLAIVFRSNSFQRLVGLSKKQLCLSLCNDPILIDDGKKSFFLDKWSGKKCYMIAARDLFIVWGSTSQNWEWKPLSHSRFEEVAVLRAVCWLEISGKMNTSMLSPTTDYGAYLVFKLSPHWYGIEDQLVEASVTIRGVRHTQNVLLHPKKGEMDGKFLAFSRSEMDQKYLAQNMFQNPERRRIDGKFAKGRKDGWLEVEIGEFFSGGDDEVGACLKEVDAGHWKNGLVIQGIEVRPL